ncbi:hypothetical protein IM40_06730 [Candidatus Paracaedimonas acanthamoebae]|nr:hypothetical protein IM40_06730 [Candidatus Paracaedimonas acanthamoebae]
MKRFICFLILWIHPTYCIQEISSKEWPSQIVRWSLKDNKELIFVACWHTNDINSPQHKRIKDIFQNEKPDIYIMEGFCSAREGVSPVRLKKKSAEICEKKGKCQENLYAAYLATKYQVNFIGAELSEKEQIPLLKKYGYSREDVIFYLLVQQLPYFYRDGDFETHTQKFDSSSWENMCNAFLKNKIATWIEEKVYLDYNDFLIWWKQRFGAPLNMEKEFSGWKKGCSFHESSNKEDALYTYTQRMAYWFHNHRDNHLINVIKDSVSKNHKTLIVYGISHLSNLWERLVKAFGRPSSVQIIQ